MKAKNFFKILTIALFIVSCNGGTPNIDISTNETEISFQRIEKEIYKEEYNGQLSYEEFLEIKKRHPDFMRLFLENIIAVGNFSDSVTVYYFNQFLSDAQIREVFMVTLEIYKDTDHIEEELLRAFKRFNVIFPERKIPDVYTYVSGFSYPMVVDSTLLGIGLDFYLGGDKEYYTLLGIPVYKSRNLNPENIASDAVKAWLITEFELKSENTDLLSHMIYHGKLLYAMDLILPEVPDSIKIGYSEQEMTWLKENEKDMWFHFAENDLLYNKEGKQIQKYIGEAPFTPGFPDGSPGMAGRWVGWQIVRQYMKNTNPKDVKNLFETEDAQKILKLSKYKPA